MILSVSRRTDIPNYYSEWFLNRIKEGYLYVRNPRNFHQVSEIDLSPEVVDCIVFWTKNPEPMLDKLEQLKDYPYYFQFTLTGYGKDMEPALPHKKENMIPVFQKLSAMIGNEKVIWRYDPIVVTETYSEEYHVKAFREIASSLNGYCKRVVISFVDSYSKIKKNLNDIGAIDKNQEELCDFSKKLAEIAKSNGMEIETCAELMDLSSCGIRHSSCIDPKLIETIIGCPIKTGKDKNQRGECGCVESVEIGAYDTCMNGCKYCYATYSEELVKANRALYDIYSPILCSNISKEDIITKRTLKSNREGQLSLFDLV